MDSKQRQLVNKYIDLFFRRKVFIIAMLLLSLPVGLGVYLLTPKVYQATSLLSYEQQKISPNKMSADVSSRIRDIVSTLTQIVTSRTNLEKLIVDLKLYPEARVKMPMEDVVESMRKAIKIEPSSQGDIFKITFTHQSPDKAVKVTNALAAKFIEENLKYREERATETSSYTSNELETARETMDRKENSMRDYKLKYYNEMPEQRESNVARLIALQKQYQDRQVSIQELERTCVLIQDQITNRKKILDATLAEKEETGGNAGTSTQDVSLTSEVRLAKAKLALEQLLSRYTAKHPEVKRVKAIIGNLESEAARAQPSAASLQEGVTTAGSREGQTSMTPGKSVVDTVVLQLETQKKNLLLNIDAIKSEKELGKKSIAQYEEWVAAAPIREAEWSALTREYNQLKRHYDYLVAQDLEAKSMLNLEKRQKGSQFEIEDPARLPEKPIKPNFPMIMGIALAIGIGAGFGLSLVLDYFDATFRDPETIEALLGVPLIATIPYLEIKSEKNKKKKWQLFSAIFLIAAAIAVAALFVVVWVKGYIIV
jgi:polysaccharide chain length determinant protein (PEP-CTERM system associated)